MSKNKNRKRNADVANTTGRITDRPKRDTGNIIDNPIEIQLSGPKHFFREDDSVHILAFKTGSYRNSVPLTTAELRNLRDKVTEWLGDDYGPRPPAGHSLAQLVYEHGTGAHPDAAG